ncbi:MAG: DUF998 domain-containing protein [Alphaproteobacteria bacterium]|nr:DUF998 domain-containing protein [Alphaproteobacteria bacterium]
MAPVVFLLSIVIGGAFRVGYSHLIDPVSALGMSGADGSGLVNAAWTATGLLIICLGVALWRDRQGPGRVVAVAILIAGATSAAISTWCPMDPPGVPMSGAQLGHNILVGVAAFAFAAALLAAALSRRVSATFRLLTWLALFAMVAGGAGAAISQSLGWNLVGAFERVTQAGYHAWLLITAGTGLWRGWHAA